jgi:hypothetical protein
MFVIIGEIVVLLEVVILAVLEVVVVVVVVVILLVVQEVGALNNVKNVGQKILILGVRDQM